MSTPLKFYLQFLIGVVCCTAICAGISSGLEFNWFNSSPKQRGYEIFPTYQEHAIENPDVVLLGSSCMRWGTIPHYIEDRLEELSGSSRQVWSLGVHGGFAPQLDYLIEHAFSQNRKPSIVVIEVAASYWNELRDDDSVVQYWKWFAPLSETFLNSLSQPWEYTSAGLGRCMSGPASIWRAGKMLTYPQSYTQWNDLLSSSSSLRGGFWTEAQIQADMQRNGVLTEKAKENAAEQLQLQLERCQPIQIGEKWQKHLDRARQVCAKNGAKLILLATPFGFDYLEHKDSQADHTYKKWLRENAKDSLLLDWSNPNDFNSVIQDARLKLKPGDFFNAGHLAPSGALKVSEVLALKLYPLLTRRTPSMVVPSTH